MPDEPATAHWYYVGHYGQLGPLTLEQMGELVRDGVVANDTYVWKEGMPDWTTASRCDELLRHGLVSPSAGPPPVPSFQVPPGSLQRITGSTEPSVLTWGAGAPISDRSRVLGGGLNLIPGVGRIYLGYVAIGVLQALTTLLCGVGFLWALVDSIFILSGGLKHDGYGRRFAE